MSRVMVTGGAGSIGSELVRQLVKDNSVFIFDIDETRTYDLYEELRQKDYKVDYRLGDVRNRTSVAESFSDFKPNIVYHVAAYKHVSPAEKYPQETCSVNIDGAWNIIDYANRYEVEKLVYVSTDKVVNAHGIMGASKRVGEIMAKNFGYVAVRFGNVMASRGSVIDIWNRQIERGEPITITDPKMERYFMTIPQACELVREAAELYHKGHVMVMDMGKRKTIMKFAKEFIRDRGLKGYPMRIIGARPGESMVEELMTKEEEGRATKIKNFWII